MDVLKKSFDAVNLSSRDYVSLLANWNGVLLKSGRVKRPSLAQRIFDNSGFTPTMKENGEESEWFRVLLKTLDLVYGRAM